MAPEEERPWYAIRVKSNRERVAAEGLKSKDYEVLFPAYEEPRSRRTRPAQIPLFPGYIFCRLDVNNRLPVLTVSGVVHIVGNGRVPEPVDPVEIAGVRALLDSRLSVSPFQFPPVGHRVQIEAGPLRGVEGTVLAHRDTAKLVVSVSLLQRSIAVDVERDWLSPR